MKQQNPIVNRLQQQKERVTRMLSPGSSRPRADQRSRAFSPVALDFGGRKFQLAAQEMRILDKDILGTFSSKRAMDMANTIQAKFKRPKSMLHISPAAESVRSAWSEIEQVFPSQISGEAESSPEPAELRRGSIIQRFETFPQPGQSLESLKEQSQENPAVRRSDVASQPKKLNLPPRERLSARVQELKISQKEQKNVKRPSVHEPLKSSSTLGETIQRQRQTGKLVGKAETRSGIQPSEKKSESEVKTSVQQEQSSAKPEYPESSPQMPLKQHLQRRKAAIESLRAGVTRQVSTDTPLKMVGPKMEVIQRKAILSGGRPRLAVPSPTRDSLLQLKPSVLSLYDPAAAWKAARGSLQPAKSIVSDAIDKARAPISAVQNTISGPVEKAVRTVTTPIKALESSIHESEDKAIDTVATPIKSAQATLATMVGNEEPSSPAAQNTAWPRENRPSSHDELAEKILPLVKRLLEIESERTGRQFP